VNDSYTNQRGAKAPMWSRAFARLLACDGDFVPRTTILRVVLAWPPYRQRGPLIGDEFPIVDIRP